MRGVALVLHSVDTCLSIANGLGFKVVNVVTTPYAAVVAVAALDTLGVVSMRVIRTSFHIQINIMAIAFALVVESE